MKGTAREGAPHLQRQGRRRLCGLGVADAFALSEKFEDKLTQYSGNLPRAAVELAQDWRMDKAMRKLRGHAACADKDNLMLISGTGEVIDAGRRHAGHRQRRQLSRSPPRARCTKTRTLPATEIAGKALQIASEICVYTNSNIIVETV